MGCAWKFACEHLGAACPRYLAGLKFLDTRNLVLPFEAVQCRRSRFLDGSLRSVSDGPEVWCARLVGRVKGQRPRVP